MTRLALLVLLILVGYLLWRYLRSRAHTHGKQVYWQAVLTVVVVVLLGLAATGRLHVLVALGATLLAMAGRLLPLLRYWPMFRQIYIRYKTVHPDPGQTTQVRTTYLAMSLVHDSGDMDGEVLAGSLIGRRLSSLSRDEFETLCDECRAHDSEALRLLAAWVDRLHPEWSAQGGSADGAAAVPTDGEMTVAEAREILGLDSNARREEVIASHRRLMARLHPDKGGSNYLASKINQARDVLLHALE